MIIYKISFKEVFFSKKLIITTRNDLFTIRVAIKSEDAFKEIIDYIQSRKEEIGNKTSINSMPNVEINSNFSDELVKLSELKQKGIITEEEFNTSKAKILGKI